ncbi:MAG: CRISPR-associated endonuclease Cas1 [Anaerolineales bacterium]|nr:CRISPR-associated endonuclease Cas1 [Anaerolineales bacterium]
MTVIHIREQGATVRRRGERLVISKHREVIDQFPFAKVEELALYGNVQVTAQAMATLLEQGVRVVYLSSFGKMRGVVSSGSKQAQLRQEQYRLMSDESANLRLAKAVVEGKIHNQRVLLQRQQRRLSSLNERGAGSVMDQGAFNSALNGMLTMGRSAQQATDSNSLRGFEGKAAR